METNVNITSGSIFKISTLSNGVFLPRMIWFWRANKVVVGGKTTELKNHIINCYKMVENHIKIRTKPNTHTKKKKHKLSTQVSAIPNTTKSNYEIIQKKTYYNFKPLNLISSFPRSCLCFTFFHNHFHKPLQFPSLIYF